MQTPEEKRIKKAEYMRRWYAEHKEQEHAVRAKRRRENPEGKQATDKRSYEKHRDKRLAQKKTYHLEHREAILAKQRESYRQHREARLVSEEERLSGIATEQLAQPGAGGTS